MPAALAISVTAVVMGALIGCGADGNSSTGEHSDSTVTTSSLSKAAFIKKASAACVREGEGAMGKAAAYVEEHSGEGLPREVLIANTAKTVLLPIVEAQISAIRKLGAPAGDEEEIDSILDAQEMAVREVRGLKKVEAMTAMFVEYFADVGRKFEAYGFKACALS
jgi:hypothetical protein